MYVNCKTINLFSHAFYFANFLNRDKLAKLNGSKIKHFSRSTFFC